VLKKERNQIKDPKTTALSAENYSQWKKQQYLKTKAFIFL